MLTLFDALLSQHARSLKPTRYTEPMIKQLQLFFEEVVLENSLQALVVESIPLRKARTMREVERVRRIGNTARFPFFLISPDDELTNSLQNDVSTKASTSNLILLPHTADDQSSESFVVIADPYFSALLCTVNVSTNREHVEHQVIHTFDPDVIYTALEYLQARFAAEHPAHAALFHEAIHRSMPKSTSLPLTLSVTTKLANLWQEQTGREIAVNRIATAIRQSLELDQVLQTAVNEVGAALGTKFCALLVESEEEDESLSVTYFREELIEDDCATIRSDLEAYKRRLRNNPQQYVRDGVSSSTSDGWEQSPQIVVPISFLGHFVGVLFVQADEMSRAWQESEVLLLQTVADQLAIAVKHARLYVKSQQEALRDELTGIFNRRFFEIQLEREYKLAERKNSTFALVMIDFDNFKSVNDLHGYAVGNRFLKYIAHLLRSSLRAFDTLARYGGEEFVVILPQVTEHDAIACAERLRRVIETFEMPEVPSITASLGVAVFPEAGSIIPEMLAAADHALHRAKSEGQNCICVAPTRNKRERDDRLFDELPAVVTF